MYTTNIIAVMLLLKAKKPVPYKSYLIYFKSKQKKIKQSSLARLTTMTSWQLQLKMLAYFTLLLATLATFLLIEFREYCPTQTNDIKKTKFLFN